MSPAAHIARNSQTKRSDLSVYAAIPSAPRTTANSDSAPIRRQFEPYQASAGWAEPSVEIPASVMAAAAFPRVPAVP